MKKNLKKMTALFLSAALSAGLITGCGASASKQSTSTEAQTESTTAAPETTESPSEAASEAADSDLTRTVTDMAGREVKLPEEITSIATFGSIGVINAFVELMGCGDLICNDMTASFTKSDKWAMQYEFAPQMKGAPVLQNPDGEIQMEEVLALNPDLCLVMSKDLIEPLEKNGMNVVYFE